MTQNMSSSDRIRELNEVDKDVTKLLHSAGRALQILSASHISDESLTDQKASFSTASSEYFATLSSIDVHLRRQIYALEEADIVSSELVSNETQSNLAVPPAMAVMGGTLGHDSGKQAKPEKPGGGLGNLDVGWLNSRNDNVGKEMEAELWAKAREMLERYEKTSGRKQDNEVMEVDMEQDEMIVLET